MAKTPILGLGNDGANEGYWRVQIRSERTGRWVKMGGGVKFETNHANYGPISGVGFFVGGARPGVAYVKVENHEFIPDGTIIEVPSTDFEDVKAIIDPTPDKVIEAVKPNIAPEFKEEADSLDESAGKVKDLKAGDIVQQGTEAALFGKITAASHGESVSKVSVEWADGSKFDMDLDPNKPVKIWKPEEVDAPIQWSDVNGVEVKGESTIINSILTGEGFKVDGSPDSPLSAIDADVISDDHRKAIDSYTRSSLWRSLNSYLRSDSTAEKDEKLEAIISTLDDAISENGEVFEAGRVFRGQRIETSDVDSKWPEIMENLKPGDLITEQSYLSTSNSSLLAAREFGIGSYGTWSRIAEDAVNADAPGGNGSIFWAIDVPVGSTAFVLPDGMGYGQGSEREVLLPRGSELKVKSVNRVKQDRTDLPDGEERYNYFVEVELVPVASQQKVVDAPTEWKSVDGVEGKGETDVFDGLDRERFEYGQLRLPVATADPDGFDYDRMRAISNYTGADYTEINTYLRTGELDEDSTYDEEIMNSEIELIDAAIAENGYVEEAARVFRGMRLKKSSKVSGKSWSDVLANLNIGDVVSDSAYTSTSNNPAVAYRGFGPGLPVGDYFSSTSGSSKGSIGSDSVNNLDNAFWSIDVPAGSTALALPVNSDKFEITSDEREEEVILPRDSSFRVKAIRRVKQNRKDGVEAYNYFIDAELLPVEVEQEQEVVNAPTVKEFDDLSRYKRIGGPLGSNDGGIYENEGGIKIYVKEPQDELHGENEILASKLYERLGIETVEMRHGRLADGTEVTYSYWINAESDLRERLDDEDEDYLKKLQEGFAVDAWLANWDVAGLVYDNIVSDREGNPVRIDPGGALLFRAQGEPKGSAFGNSADEIDTLADGTNPQSARIFGDMTEEQKKKAAARLKWITPEEIEELVKEQISDPAVAEKLARTLIARRENILERFGLAGEEIVDAATGRVEINGVQSFGASSIFDDVLTDTTINVSGLENPVPVLNDKLISDEQYEALIEYTGDAYDPVNTALRVEESAGTPINNQEVLDLIENLDGAFEANGPTKWDTRVFRGDILDITSPTGVNWAKVMDDLRVGDEILDAGYISTSNNPEVARKFSMRRDENPSAANASDHSISGKYGTVFWAINLPAGSNAINVSELSQSRHEDEVILARGSRLRVGSIRRVKQEGAEDLELYNYYIEAELVPARKVVDALTPEELDDLSAEELMERLPTKETATNRQIEAVRSYAHQGHAAINGYLRRGDKAVYEIGGIKYVYNSWADNEFSYPLNRVTGEISELDGLMDESPGLVEDTTLYRFIEDVDLSKTMMTTLKPGDEMTDEGFTSTSRGFEWKYEGPNPSMARWVITAPKGTKGLYIDWFKNGELDTGGEQEVLLPRGTTFVVEKVDGHLIYVNIKPKEVDALTEADSKPSAEVSVLDKILSGEDSVFDYTALPSPNLEPLDIDKVTDEQRSALFKYVGTDYKTINTYLRTDKLTDLYGQELEFEDQAEEEKFTDSTLGVIRNLDITISQFGVLDEPTTVYRGIQIKEGDESLLEMFRTLKPGDSFIDEGYTSTSKGAKYAHGFGKSDLRENAFLVINIPAGGKALPLPIRVTEGEEEVLLPRRTEFKVKGIKTVPRVSASGEKYDQYYVEVDVVVPEKGTQTGIFQEYGEAGKNAVENTPLPELGFDPEEEITIYRGVPKGITDINAGDWVTTLPQLAKDYAGDGDVISMKVKAKDLLADPSSGEGAYTEEMVYRPTEPEAEAPAAEEPKVALVLNALFNSTPSAIFSWLDDGGPETLTSKQKDVLGWYQQAGYIPINSYLRGYETYENRKQVARENVSVLDEIFDSSNGTPSDAILYRAIIGNSDLKMEDLSVGSVLNDKGYLSTTVSQKFIKNWLKEHSDDGGFVLKLTVPKGTKAVSPYAKIGDEDFKHEYELILDRDSNIEITNIDYENRIVEGVVSMNPKNKEKE